MFGILKGIGCSPSAFSAIMSTLWSKRLRLRKATLLVMLLSGRVTQASLVYIAVEIMFRSSEQQCGYFVFTLLCCFHHKSAVICRTEDQVTNLHIFPLVYACSAIKCIMQYCVCKQS